MMRTVFMIAAIACGAAAPLMAQQSWSAAPSEETPLPAGEMHIRTGIVLMGQIYKTLAQIQDSQSAQASVATIVRYTRELHVWAQAIASLPPLTDEMRHSYERRYLPIIQQLNDHLRVQGERLAASDYYGSQDLSTALISLYCAVQQ